MVANPHATKFIRSSAMPFRLLRFAGARHHPEGRMFRTHETLKPSYDAVIIGAGGHGLAAAYYLSRDHGMRNVAVLERGYIGGGNTGRNTTIIRSNYLTPEGVAFYDESVRLWQRPRSRLRPESVLFHARTFHPGPHRLRRAHHALAGRGQQAPRRGQRNGRTGRRGARPARRSTFPVAGMRRSWARSITRPVRSRVTTPWPGAMVAAPTGAAWKSTRKPK